MSTPHVIILGNRTTDDDLCEWDLLYDPYVFAELWIYLQQRPPPEIADLGLCNVCTFAETDKEARKAFLAWIDQDCPLIGNPEALWFIWKDRAHCRTPEEIAQVADRAAELFLRKDPIVADVVRGVALDCRQEEGEAVDLDLSDFDLLRQHEQTRPLLIWSMRGIAKLARQAAAKGSDLMTMLMPP
jgi:hypothetical protein